ncbi:MAG: hypothetical protein D6730_22105 [Bacteroidetes bacterium]|nr:MAG: hypothetical protein D6730_22105 [Bacteroidota bacterium]
MNGQQQQATELLRLDDSGIFHWNFVAGANITLADAQRAYRQVAKMLDGKKVPVLVDMRAPVKIERAARQYYASEAKNYFCAGAIIVGSPFSKILANFFMGFNKPPMPMRVVNAEEEGMEWLKSAV